MVVFVFEAIAIVCILIIAGLMPDESQKLFRQLWRWLGRVARHETGCIVVIGAGSFALAATMSLAIHAPVPAAHEEFAFLLGSDTFSSGRVTNATHPFWEHFETFNVLQQPSYQMSLPPGQSLWLTLGELVGRPIAGVWLSLGCAMAAVTWMLFVWLPRRWALLASVMLLVNFRILRFSSQQFVGGADAMLGGALLFGSLPLLRRQPSWPAGALFGTGGGLLLLSQPPLGSLALVCAVAVLVFWRVHDGRLNLSGDLKNIILPALLPLLICGGWLAYYNARVTGNASTLPSQAYAQQYGDVTALELATLSEGVEVERTRTIPMPTFSEESLAAMTSEAENNSKWMVKLVFIAAFYLGVSLVIPVVVAGRAFRSSTILAAMIVFAVLLGALLYSTSASQPRHLMPAVCLLFYLVGEGLRRLWHWRVRKTPMGPVLVFGLPLLVFLLHSLLIYDYVQQPVIRDLQWSTTRADMIADMHRNEKKDLVFVRYSPEHNVKYEWVYNEADIDAAEVVWARELSPEQNQQLMEHFADREVWLVEADETPPRRTVIESRDFFSPTPPSAETTEDGT